MAFKPPRAVSFSFLFFCVSSFFDHSLSLSSLRRRSASETRASSSHIKLTTSDDKHFAWILWNQILGKTWQSAANILEFNKLDSTTYILKFNKLGSTKNLISTQNPTISK